MAWWEDFAEAEPEFAERVRARFAVGKHCTMATLRRDGSPRISGTEVDFDGGLFLGSMAGAVKALDLRRDPRVALHSPSVDPPEGEEGGWLGDAKIAGRAHEVDPRGEDGSHRFRIEITEVVLTRLGGEPPDHLVIESWHPGRGLERRTRR
jgi:hypothetical protein